jgi:hypothetical protein
VTLVVDLCGFIQMTIPFGRLYKQVVLGPTRILTWMPSEAGSLGKGTFNHQNKYIVLWEMSQMQYLSIWSMHEAARLFVDRN